MARLSVICCSFLLKLNAVESDLSGKQAENGRVACGRSRGSTCSRWLPGSVAMRRVELFFCLSQACCARKSVFKEKTRAVQDLQTGQAFHANKHQLRTKRLHSVLVIVIG